MFLCKNSETCVLQNVNFTPCLSNNIISIGQLAEGGVRILMHGPWVWVHDKSGKHIIEVSNSLNRLYKIDLNEVESQCLLCEKELAT